MNLTDLLEAGTADLTVAPDLLPRARERGAARLRRRRALRAAAVGTVTAALVAAAVLVLPRGDRPDALQPANSAADLNPAFGAAARSWWNGHREEVDSGDRGFFDDVSAPAQVLWSGTTAGGPGAVVTQRVVLHAGPNNNAVDAGPHTLYGFFGPAGGGGVRLVGTDYRRDVAQEYDVPVRGWWVDEKRTVLAVLTEGEQLAVSSAWTYTTDGKALRTDWQPLTEVGGGVGVLQTPWTSSLIVAKQPVTTVWDLRSAAGGERLAGTSDRHLPWQGVRGVGGQASVTADEAATPLTAAMDAGMPLMASSVGYGNWWLNGPDLLVGERSLDADPSRVYALVGGQLVDGGPIDPKAALPVAMRLPDGRGWAVAAYGQDLRWRHAGGTWTDAGKDAALLPAGTDLEVQVAGTVVRLA